MFLINNPTIYLQLMLQPNQESLSKIDGIIADIRMINLHLHNFVVYLSEKREDQKQSERQKKIQDFRKLNLAHLQQHTKRVSEYLKKCFRDALRTKVSLTPLTFRFFKSRAKEQNFLRFQNTNYGVKFTFTDFQREALLHLELYRRTHGGRLSNLALRKLELSFLFDLSQRVTEGILHVQGLQQEGKSILQELTEIMSGQCCDQCHRHLNFNSEYMSYLPPTIRELIDYKEKEKKIKIYYHQNCL